MAARYRKTKEMNLKELSPRGSMRPHLHLSFEDLPEAKNWKVGETYEVGLKVKQTAMHQEEGTEGGASFEIVGVMVEKSNPKPKRYGEKKA